ncbi:hypothetical protein Syun_013632 [Stephania yunnanensis]|uniref:Uncharacterized protein n=1 Tax=Stephania yunnanensis TaxID=152371 RepID=A0AAP0P7T0_9MAGN
MFVHAIRILSSLTEEKWELKKEMFRGLGWSEDDILFVFKRNPNAFTVSDKKIREIVRYLENAGGYDSSFLVLHPEMCLYSLEGRIKPRFQIWQILRSKKLLNASLPTVCKMRDEVFSEKCVLPYVDIVGKYCKADDGK